MIYNVLQVAFGAVRKITAPPIYYQYDAKQVLRFAGITLPDVYRVDFCNVGDSRTKPMVGTAEDGVEVPDEYLRTGKNVMAYLVVSSGDDDVETRYEITIPVTGRPTPTDVEPTPAQETTIDTLISLLNGATDDAEAAARLAVSAKQSAEAAQGAAETAQGEAEAAQRGAEAAQGEAEAAKRIAENAQSGAVAAKGAAETAQGAAEIAQVAAEDAANRAEQAAGTSGYIEIEINADGHLIYTRTDAVDVDFELVDGHLIMEAI